ncbi:MAG: murein biosynthesis integral membrane protein MurJ [Patescibacteria group bacterium]
MFKKLLNKLQSTIAGGAIIIAFFSVISKVLGLYRNRLLASNFGAGDVLDTYFAAFKIPDLVFNILILGALSASFIPVFVQHWSKNHEETWRIANSVLNILLIALIIISIILFVLAPQLTRLIAPGFDEAKQALTASLTQVMLLSVIFFTISNVVAGILNSFRRFFAYSLAPVFYNVGIIFGILVLAPRMGSMGLAWGVVIGALLHLIVQLPTVFKVGFRYWPIIDLKHEGVRKIFKLMLPRTFGLAVNQINQLIIVIIASTLMAGSVAVFNFANDLQSFPISIFGVSLAIAAFPVFSQAFTENNQSKFVSHFSKTFRRVLFLIIPASVMVLLLRAQLVRLILGTGQFDWTDTVLTARTFGYFSISLFAQALIPLLARSFFAKHDTKTPVIISLISMVINIGLAYTFTRFMDIAGLGLAFSIAAIINMVLLLLVLRKRVGYLDDRKIIGSLAKIVLISLAMGGAIQWLKYLIAPVVDMQTFFGVLIQTGGAIIGGGLIYFLLSIFFKSDEIDIVRQWLLKFKKYLVRSN